MKLNIKKLNSNAKLPTYGTSGSAGADLYSLENVVIEPNKTVFVHTGLSMEIPEGYAGFVYARSGMASKKDLAPANKVGVVDSDYRGEIMVAIHNHGCEVRSIEIGDRIAQIVIAACVRCEFTECDELGQTQRGEGGFGSTGKK